MDILTQALRRVVKVRPDEIRAMLWAFAYFFCLLSSYFILRPLRDESAIAAGVGNLQWPFTATFVVMLVALPLFALLVQRMPRQRFIPWVYHFFAFSLLLFFALGYLMPRHPYIAGAFFVWISVFNLFVVTVFWGFMADLFSSEQGKRLFGFIAAGGSAGALTGSSLTIGLAPVIGPTNLLLISALLFEVAVLCVRQILKTSQAQKLSQGPITRSANDEVIGGGILAGLTEIVRSPFLMLICCHVLLLSLTNTFLYFQQASIVSAAFDNPVERTRFFANIDWWVNIVTIVLQLTLTGRAMVGLGIGSALASLAIVTMGGFLALAIMPTLTVLIVFQTVKRAAEFGFANPARETLFTVVTREQKYKAKSVIDTAVFRGGDAVNGWIYTGLRSIGLDLSAIALVAVPISAAWLGLLLLLGRKQEQLAQSKPAE
jgi:AAA family ATP:ADP antiporter